MALPSLAGVRKMKTLLAVDDTRFSQAATRPSSNKPARREMKCGWYTSSTY